MTETIEKPDTKSLGRTSAGMSRLELRTAMARSIAATEPPLASPATPLGEALERMRGKRGEALLVCEGEQLVGIMTERDVLLRVLGRAVDLSRPVSEVMTAAPETLAADATLYEAMRMMERGGYRNLPLVEDGRVVGVLHQHELLEYIAEAFPQEILNLPPRPHQLMEEPEGA